MDSGIDTRSQSSDEGREAADTLSPMDSSSVIGRYGKRYMDRGTVLTVRPVATEADVRSGRTVLTADSFLVEGFKQDEATASREKKSLRKLSPINGLPRPFQSNRLNFLANFHTALDLLPQGHSLLENLLHAIRETPQTPEAILLHQVLVCTMDRRAGTFSANPFILPYIEIGMVLTEESVEKSFDMLRFEYQSLWFQEMKGIRVPDFHRNYKGKNRAPLINPRSNRRDRARSQSPKPGRDKGRSWSTLSFR